MKKTVSPHDAFFRQSMEDTHTATDFFRFHLPDDIKKQIDFATLRLKSDSFVSPDLKNQYTDLLYSVKIKQQDGYVFLLAEHKSYSDRLMALQIWSYICRILEQDYKQHKQDEKILGRARKPYYFPMVFPIIFYHGRTPCSAPTDLADCFQDSALARKYLYGGFPLVDVTQISDEELSSHGTASMFELAQKHIFNGDIEKNLLIMRNQGVLNNKLYDRTHFLSMLEYLSRAGKMTDKASFIRTVETSFAGEQGDIVDNLAQHFEKDALEKGILLGEERGIRLGEERGKQQITREIALSMLRKKFPLDTIKECTGLTEQALRSLSQQVKEAV